MIFTRDQYDIYKGFTSGRNWCSNPRNPKIIKLTVYGGHLESGNDINRLPTDIIWAVGGSARRNAWSPCGGTWDNICQYTGTPAYNRCLEETIAGRDRILGTNRIKLVWNVQKGNFSQSQEIGIDGKGTDPTSYITIKQTQSHIETDIKWSVYDTLAKAGKQPTVSDKARNLFIEFAETIAKTLGVNNCFICEGTNMGEQWPWEAIEVTAEILLNMSRAGNITKRTQPAADTRWTLTTNLVGKACYKQNISDGILVGDLMCLGYWEKGLWYSESNYTATPHDFTNLLQNSTGNWTTPEGMYWIYGNLAYEYLPARWSGSCVLGWIKPSFFLIPLQNQQSLGIPLYDTWSNNRKRRSLSTGIGGLQVGSWTDKDWTPERIVAYYDPASWAEDGSWGYRTPIYMINRIIRLQAVLEIAGNRIDAALNTIATEQDKLRTAVYQNRLALDYLLAAEGGVCGKFNRTNCCLQINPVGKEVADLTAELRKVIHVPVQTWHGIMDDDGFLGGIFRNWKQAAFMVGMALLGLLLLPCLMPIIKNAIQSTVESVVTTTHQKQLNMILKPEITSSHDNPADQKAAFIIPS